MTLGISGGAVDNRQFHLISHIKVFALTKPLDTMRNEYGTRTTENL